MVQVGRKVWRMGSWYGFISWWATYLRKCWSYGRGKLDRTKMQLRYSGEKFRKMENLSVVKNSEQNNLQLQFMNWQFCVHFLTNTEASQRESLEYQISNQATKIPTWTRETCNNTKNEEASRGVEYRALSLFRDEGGDSGDSWWFGKKNKEVPGERKNVAHQRADNRKVVVALMRFSRWLFLINHLQQLKINQSVTRQVGVMRVFIEGIAHAKPSHCYKVQHNW